MATETLRPNAAGDETSLPDEFPDTAAHHTLVDEASADDASTYVIQDSAVAHERDLYHLPASAGSGVINFIKIYFRCALAYTGGGEAKPSLKSNSTVTDGTIVNPEYPAWNTYSQQWNTNPADSQAWEWADMDALQIGVSMKAGSYAIWCTQVYVEVDYVVSGWSGKVGGVTDPAKVMGIAKANIGKVIGVS